MAPSLFFLPKPVFPNASDRFGRRRKADKKDAEMQTEMPFYECPEEVDRYTDVVEQSTKTLAAALAALERLQRTSSIKVVV